MLLIVLEVHFSLLFANKAPFRVCFVVCKIRSPLFFMSIPTIVLFHARPKECSGFKLRLRNIRLPFGGLKMYRNLWDPGQLLPRVLKPYRIS